MILSFKEQFVHPIQLSQYEAGTTFHPNKDVHQPCPISIDAKPKLHTLREDPSNRWQAGRKIHYWKGSSRNPSINPYPFGDGECTGVQRVRIDWWKGFPVLPSPRAAYTTGKREAYVFIMKEGAWEILNDEEVKALAINDGFPSVESFFEWFDRNWLGKIIHWTDKRY